MFVLLANSWGCVEFCGMKAEEDPNQRHPHENQELLLGPVKVGENIEIRERPLNWSRVDVSVSREELSEVGAVSGRKEQTLWL